jgi:DNA repair exonuclease SbcCD ATPase subunit
MKPAVKMLPVSSPLTADFTSTPNNNSEKLADNNDQNKRYSISSDTIRAKIFWTQKKIQDERKAQEETLNKYLEELSRPANTDIYKQQLRTEFELKSNRSTETLEQLQRQLAACEQRLRDVVTHSTRATLPLVKDTRNSSSSSPMFSSHRRRLSLPQTDLAFNNRTSRSNSPVVQHRIRRHSVAPTQPTLYSTKNSNSDVPVAHESQQQQQQPDVDAETDRQHPQPIQEKEEGFVELLVELQSERRQFKQLRLAIDELQSRVETETDDYQLEIDKLTGRRERLEEQINELMEVHELQLNQVKQDLANMQERVEYQLDERLRDMQDLLESYQTKIVKMEQQQQQQIQLMSMEGLENSSLRFLMTKLANVLLAFVAVFLVLISTAEHFVRPLATNRLRFTAICVALCVVIVGINYSSTV